jgi:hypothetical protein
MSKNISDDEKQLIKKYRQLTNKNNPLTSDELQVMANLREQLQKQRKSAQNQFILASCLLALNLILFPILFPLIFFTLFFFIFSLRFL